jgi:hypothetical protein
MTKQNTRRTQVLAELSGLRSGVTTSPIESLGPVQLSTAKSSVVNYVAALPIVTH